MFKFWKKQSAPVSLPIDGPWSVSQGENEGKIAIVRLNTGYQQFGRLPEYQHQVGIAVPLRAPDSTGLPSGEENWSLNEVEDALSDSLEANAESLFVASINHKWDERVRFLHEGTPNRCGNVLRKFGSGLPVTNCS